MPSSFFPPYVQNNSSGDNYNYHDLPPEIATEQQALNRKQQIANMLIQQGLQPAQGQMVGGWYVPASPLQGLAGLAQVAAGVYGSHKNDEARKGLVGKSNQMYADAMQQYMDATKDKSATVTPEIAGPGAPQQAAPQQPTPYQQLPVSEAPKAATGYQMGADESGWAPQEPIRDYNAAPSVPAPAIQEGPRPTGGAASQTTVTPRTAEQKREAMMKLAMSTIPQAQRMGQFLMNEMDKREARGDTLTARKEDREDTQAFNAQQNDLNRDSRAELSKLLLGQKGEALQTQMDMLRSQLDDKAAARGDRERLERRMQDKELEFKKWQTEQTLASKKEVQGMKTGVNRPMSATAQKELIQTEEELQGSHQAVEHLKSALSLNNKALGFTGASSLAQAGSMLPDALRPKSVDATVDLENLIQGSTLPQLKAIFGGMPTEGERKILLDVAGSTSKTPEQRKAIFERAIQGANNRIKFNGEKAKQLRGGTYFSGDGGLDTSADPNPISPLVGQGASTSAVAPFDDPNEEAAYQEFKRKHK